MQRNRGRRRRARRDFGELRQINAASAFLWQKIR